MGGHAFWIVQFSNDLPTDNERDHTRLFQKAATVVYLVDV
jgi:hypothetical protein